MMAMRRVHPGLVTALWLLPLLALVQITLAHQFRLAGVYPSLVLVLVVDWGILRGMDEGMLWAFLGGLCIDTFSGWPLGIATVSMVIVASLVSLGQGTFIRTHALLPLATMFGATIVYYVIVLFLYESTQHPVDWLVALRDIALPAAIYNTVLNIPGFWLVQRLERRVYPVPRANW